MDALVMWLIALAVVVCLAIGFWGVFLVVIKLIGRWVSRRP
ncbi:MAG TPA: hypothetical protein VL086_00375 [Candidatus Nitrosotalea sp.]|nr:hypothetical protein [Candidatus Nitrosotalea sp.]